VYYSLGCQIFHSLCNLKTPAQQPPRGVLYLFADVISAYRAVTAIIK